jgi:hypothetical protein
MVNKKKVNKKRAIGFSQIILGLILLVGVIAAFFVSFNYFDDKEEEFFEMVEWDYTKDYKNSSLDIRAIGVMGFYDAYTNNIYAVESQKSVFYSTELILLIFSIMFLLNGCANLVENQ